MPAVRHFLTASVPLFAFLAPTALHAQSIAQPPIAQSGNSQDLQKIITVAAKHYHLPERWIVEVIRAESNANARATSPKGAMGLMQIMSGTWNYLRRKMSLGDNPYDVRDNVFAGSAYLRELYDRFGFPGCLAAYNAGPGRYLRWIKGRKNLPRETVNYVRVITTRLGGDAAALQSIPAQNIKAAANPAASSLFVRMPAAADRHMEGQKLDNPAAPPVQDQDTLPSIFVARPRPSSKP